MLRGMRRKTGINTVDAKNPYFCKADSPLGWENWPLRCSCTVP